MSDVKIKRDTNTDTQHQIVALIKQRDTLAEVLENVLSAGYDGPLPDYARQPARDALAAVKGGQHE